jgi:hypothetical protein
MEVKYQKIIYPELEALSHDELLELWKLFGISLDGDDTASSSSDLDKVWLIGPLLADTGFIELRRAIDDLHHGNQS